MKKLIYKGLLLFLLVIISISLLSRLIAKPFWGNPQIVAKMDRLESNDYAPDTYFVGSSNIFRQIKPSIFDSLVDEKITSFNLGNDGSFVCQTNFVVDQIISSDPSIKYVFVELNSYDDLKDSRYLTTKSKYYLAFSDLKSQLYNVAKSHLGDKRKKKSILRRINSFYQSLFKIQMRKDYLLYHIGRDWYKINGPDGDGYMPLEGRKVENAAEKAQIGTMTRNIKMAYLKAQKRGGPYFYFNDKQLSDIKKEIVRCERLGIKLIYIMLPKYFPMDTMARMYSLFQNIPEANRLDICDPGKFPDLHNIYYKWDGGHYNDEGAEIFTRHLAELFNELK